MKSPKQSIEKVAVVRCSSYDKKKVEKAVRQALKLIKFDPKNRTKVLIKPNLVAVSLDKGKQIAISTHLSLIEAVCKFLKENKCKIYIGESSFMDTDSVMKQLGYNKLAKKYKAKLIVFEQEKLVKIKNPKNKILKEFPVAKIVKEVDYIIDIPKMKTHSLADVTLGIKNLYGLIPGGLKQRLHNKAKGASFSKILVDIYQNFPPQLTLLDGIIGMEGHGPTSGTPKKANLILASKNTVALDIAASTIMDFKPKKVPAIKFAVKRKLYPNYKFELVGLKKLPTIHFRKSQSRVLRSRINKLFREQPIVCDVQKCIKCRACEKHCPVKAIKLKPFPIINKKKCIRCFCCMEICPTDALYLGKPKDEMWQNYKKQKIKK